jgi:hypothetical protein
MFVFFASPRAIAPVTACFHSLEVKKVPLNAFRSLPCLNPWLSSDSLI